MAEGRPLRVAGLADLHVQETSVRPFRELFSEIAALADVLCLGGDLTNLGTVEEARILADDLATLRIPVVGVLGNHDHEDGKAAEVTKILCQQGGMKILENHTFEYQGVGFAGVKGFAGGFNKSMLSGFGEPALKAFVQEAADEAMRLERALASLQTEQIVVVLHYSPIAATCEGEPREIFPFLGCSRLADTLHHFPVKAVLHGHAHHGTYRGQTSKGIPVFNCAQWVQKDNGRPYALIEV